METEVAFLGNHMGFSMDSPFQPFSSSPDALVDPRLQAPFDHSLGGKMSPSATSQLLMADSSLWGKPSFSGPALDIFADLPDSPTDVPELSGEAQEAAATIMAASPKVQRPRRSSRATSSSSSSRNSSKSTNKSPAPTIPQIASSGVKKRSRGSAKKTQQRQKDQIKEEPNTEDGDVSLPPKEEPLPEDEVRRHKFLERNRVAASKCRQKKKEWMQDLEETKSQLEKRHGQLLGDLNSLLAEISVMKNHLMTHANCNDKNIDRWFDTEARRFVASKTNDEPQRQSTDSTAMTDAQHSRHSSVVQYSPMSSVFPSLPSPKVKQEDEGFSYDHMPDNMFNDDTL